MNITLNSGGERVCGHLGDKPTGRQPTGRQLLDDWATPVGSSGPQDIENSWMQHTYSVAPRNNRTERLFITCTNINRFTQFFHGRSHNWIYSTMMRRSLLQCGNMLWQREIKRSPVCRLFDLTCRPLLRVYTVLQYAVLEPFRLGKYGKVEFTSTQSIKHIRIENWSLLFLSYNLLMDCNTGVAQSSRSCRPDGCRPVGLSPRWLATGENCCYYGSQ